MIREREIERKLVQAVNKIGGKALKFVSPGVAGVPDRILLLMGGKVAFVEVKAEGKKLRPLQKKRIKDLRNLGFKCYILDDEKQIKEILEGVV